MIEVGLTKKMPDGKKRRYKYRDIVFDKDGWAKLPKFYPLKFDLVNGKTIDGKITPVWWDGKGWEGLRLKPHQKIIEWKRHFYEPAAA